MLDVGCFPMPAQMVIILVFLAFAEMGILWAAGSRKTPAKKIVGALLGTVLIGFLMMTTWFWPFIQEGRLFANAEKYAKRAVTGNELQAWAIKVLADPENDALKTNYPAQLRELYPGCSPRVMINTNPSLPNAYVNLFWDCGDWLGGFDIGPTNFASSGHEWQPGVYFFSQHK
jgi:hypothetical protein